MKRFFRYFALLLRQPFVALSANKLRNVMLMFTMFGNDLLFFILWLIFFHSVNNLNGWSLQTFALFQGISVAGIGFAFFLGDGSRNIAGRILNGELDMYLARPKHSLPQLIFLESSVPSLGDFLYGLFLIMLARPNGMDFILSLFCVVCVAGLYMAMVIIFQSLTFFLKGNSRLSDELYHVLLVLGTLPQHTQSFPMKLILFTAIPAGFMAIVPVETVRQHSALLLGVMAGAAIVYFWSSRHNLQRRPQALHLRHGVENMNARAIFALFMLGVKKVLAERAVLAGQVVVYCVLVSAYGVFFRGVTPEKLVRFGLTVPQLVWYLAITQIVIGCTALHWREMEREITEGDLDIPLTRPIAFWKLNMAEWFGQYVVRVAIVAPFGFGVAWWISGTLLIANPVALVQTMLCLFLAGLLFLCLQCLVGCASLWASPAEPVYRIWQKMMFLVGARSSPLLLYPLWAQGLAWFTPFPAMLAVPGNRAIGHGAFLQQVAIQIGWCALGLWAVAALAAQVRKRVMRAG